MASWDDSLMMVSVKLAGCRLGLGLVVVDGEDLRDFAADLFEPGWIFERSCGALKAEVHGFLFEVKQAAEALVCGEFADVFGFGKCHGRI